MTYLILAYPSLAAIALGLVLLDLAKVCEYEPRHALMEEATDVDPKR